MFRPACSSSLACIFIILLESHKNGMSAVSTEIELGFGVPFEDLYNRDGLVRLDGVFLHHLTTADPNLNARLANARSNPECNRRPKIGRN